MKRLFYTACLLTLVSSSIGCGGNSTPPKAPAAIESSAVDPQAWRGTVPSAGPSEAIDYPTSERRTLKNGLSVFFVKRPSGTVSLRVVTRGGAVLAPLGKSGIAAFTARMLTEGTKTKTGLQLAEASESLGSELGHDANRDSTSVSLEALPADVPRALALLAEVVQNPGFRSADVTRVIPQWVDDLKAERQSSVRVASLVALRALLGPTLGAPVTGSPQDIQTLNRNDLVAFHHEHFTPNESAVVVVGNVDVDTVMAQVEKLFGAWREPKADKRSPEPPVVTSKKTHVLLVDRPDAVQSAIFAVQPFPKRDVAGHEAREVMNTLLGGLFTSRLNINLREQHAYTYGARSLGIETRTFGLFAVSTSVERSVTADAVEQMLYELRALGDSKLERPITAEEVTRAKADLSNHLGASLEHTSRVANNVENQFVYDLPLDYYAKYPQIIDAVSLEQVKEAAKLIHPDELLIVIAGDRSAIENPLKAKGCSVEIAPDSLTE
jgi:zinc protease